MLPYAFTVFLIISFVNDSTASEIYMVVGVKYYINLVVLCWATNILYYNKTICSLRPRL